MTRRLLAFLVLAGLGVAAAGAVAAPSAPQVTRLVGKVGPGASISLTTESGARVTALEPGAYTITVTDESSEHNFRLFGPGVDRATELDFVGTVTWEVTLTDGVYTVQCDAHPFSMRGRAAVGAAAATTTTTAPAPAKLVGTVGPGFTIALQNAAGAKVRTLKAGAYTVTVRDRSRSHNFHLVGPGVDRKTGVAAVGTQTWRVRLGKGTLRFLCDPHRTSLRGAVTVR